MAPGSLPRRRPPSRIMRVGWHAPAVGSSSGAEPSSKHRAMNSTGCSGRVVLMACIAARRCGYSWSFTYCRIPEAEYSGSLRYVLFSRKETTPAAVAASATASLPLSHASSGGRAAAASMWHRRFSIRTIRGHSTHPVHRRNRSHPSRSEPPTRTQQASRPWRLRVSQ